MINSPLAREALTSPFPYACAVSHYLAEKYPKHSYSIQVAAASLKRVRPLHFHVEVVQSGRWHVPDKAVVRIHYVESLGNWRALTAISFDHTILSKEELDASLDMSRVVLVYSPLKITSLRNTILEHAQELEHAIHFSVWFLTCCKINFCKERFI